MSIRKVVIPYLVNEKGQYFEEGDRCVLTTKMSSFEGVIRKIHDYRIVFEDEEGEVVIPIDAIEGIEGVK